MHTSRLIKATTTAILVAGAIWYSTDNIEADREASQKGKADQLPRWSRTSER